MAAEKAAVKVTGMARSRDREGGERLSAGSFEVAQSIREHLFWPV